MRSLGAWPMNVWRMVDGFVDSLLHSPLAQVMQIKTAPVNELRSRLTRGSIPTVESTPKLALGFPIRLFLGSSPSPSRPEQTRFCCRGSCCRNRSLVKRPASLPHPSILPSSPNLCSTPGCHGAFTGTVENGRVRIVTNQPRFSKCVCCVEARS